MIMITEEEINDIKKRHRGDFKTLFVIYKKDGRLLKSKQLWSAVIVTIVLAHIIFNYTTPINQLKILTELVEKVLSIFPNVLGFTLTGYVLIVGIGWNDFMDTITDQDDDGYSLFQQISSIFAWGIIVQSFSLIVSYIVSLIYSVGIYSPCANVINSAVLIVIMLLSFYSLFLIIRLVLNVFHYGQEVQYFFTEKKIIEKHLENKQNNN